MCALAILFAPLMGINVPSKIVVHIRSAGCTYLRRLIDLNLKKSLQMAFFRLARF